MKFYRSMVASSAIALAAGVLAAAAPVAALANPTFTATFAENPLTVATTCDLNRLAYVNVVVSNSSYDTSAPSTIYAIDDLRVLTGAQAVPQLAKGATVAMEVPATHPISIDVLTLGVLEPVTRRSLLVRIPPDLCATAIDAAANRAASTHLGTGTRAHGHSRAATTVAIDTSVPNPLFQTSSSSNSGLETTSNERFDSAVIAAPARTHNAALETSTSARSKISILSTQRLTSPILLRKAKKAQQCPTIGGTSSTLCRYLVDAASLVLVWDWQPRTSESIDGYRVYHVFPDRAGAQLIDTRPGKDSTFSANGAAPNSGFDWCYAVTAFAGSRESDFSNSVCGQERQR